MQKRKGETVLYNLIFPVFLMVWIPSFLWILLIPANYLWDRFIFTFAMKRENVYGYQTKARDYTGWLCLAGFAADFLCSAMLLGLCLFVSSQPYDSWVFRHLNVSLGWNPPADMWGFAIMLVIVWISGCFVALFDKWILRKTGDFSEEECTKIALTMGILTAPYLMLLPVPSIFM